MTGNDDIGLIAGAALLPFGVVLWAGGAVSALACGHAVAVRRPLAGLLAFGHLRNPSAAWGAPVGPSAVYWSLTVIVISAAAGAAFAVYRLLKSITAQAGSGRRPDGLAGHAEVRQAAGSRALRRKGRVLRPGLDAPRPADVGYRLGRASGVECWASVEDSLVVLGPPRSGKGLHVVVPAILDAPGAVVTTSTRPDNLTATMKAREKLGPVAVFDPQRLAEPRRFS